jgi:hypothetical protein
MSGGPYFSATSCAVLFAVSGHEAITRSRALVLDDSFLPVGVSMKRGHTSTSRRALGLTCPTAIVSRSGSRGCEPTWTKERK